MAIVQVPASLAGGMTLISETVASANSSINLTSIPGTYKQLLLIYSGLNPSGTSSWWSFRLNNDSTSNVYEGNIRIGGTNYAFSSTWADDPPTGNMFGYNTTATTTNYRQMISGQILIDNYASTSKYKFYDGMSMYKENAVTQPYMPRVMGIYKSTSAITSIDILRVGGSDTLSNASNTSIRLYGIS